MTVNNRFLFFFIVTAFCLTSNVFAQSNIQADEVIKFVKKMLQSQQKILEARLYFTKS